MTQVSLGVAAEVLNISRTSASQLTEAGVLGAVSMRGNRRLVDLDVVQAVAERPPVATVTAPRALVVRLGLTAAVADSWRHYVGWCEDWPREDKENAIRGDWRIRAKSVLLPCHIVALVGPVVVGVFEAVAAEQVGDRLRFTVQPASSEANRAFTGKLLRLPQGPVIKRLGQTSDSPRRDAVNISVDPDASPQDRDIAGTSVLSSGREGVTTLHT